MNNNDPANREKAIFEKALDFTSSEARRAYLVSACAGDAGLLARLEALASAHDRTGGFLPEQPAAGAHPLPGTAVLPMTEKPGDRIGRYKLLEQIGEGGCGVVYMAEQEEPIRRRVALKVIKLGMDTKSVIARFEAERQALALMEHPNIAKVLDAGATETGRPYFVMELVRGIKITDYCDQRQLSTRERLDLFIQVCQAVQHAHQKGIIHRDLKPSNILVSSADGVPVPKVIDFGIAKATSQQRLTDKTLFTAFAQFLGTPAYMSPEQAELSALDIDTRSDIYSLGVLLYELLTGQTPFEAETLLKAGFDEMRRILREEEPPRPSTRLSTLSLAEVTTLGKERKEKLPALVSLVRGDLDWIVMKALEKDRQRRYDTANSLAEDVVRHTKNEPVNAAAPGMIYRTAKFARRHRVGLTAAVAVALLLIAGTAVSTWQAIRATRAEKQMKIAAVKSELVAEFMSDIWQRIKPMIPSNSDLAPLIKVVDRTAEGADRHLRGSPETEVDLLELTGGSYIELGRVERGSEMLRQALEIRRKQSGAESPEVATLLNNHGFLLSQRGLYAEAEELLQAALAIGRKHRDRTNSPYAATAGYLVHMLTAQSKLVEATRVAEELVDAAPNDISSRYTKANLLARQEKWQAAVDALAEAIELQPAQHVFWAVRAPLLLQLGDLNGHRRHCRDANARFAKADPVTSDRVIRGFLLTPSSGPELDTICQAADRNLAARLTRNSVHYYEFTKGLAEFRRGRYAEAVEPLQKMIGQPMLKDKAVPLYERDVAGYAVLAMARLQLGQTAEAKATLKQGLELARLKLPALGSGNMGENWWEILMAHQHLREARAMIEKPESK